jgi:C1A family cysteine protease
MARKYATGWIPDYPDFRDFTEETEEIRKILKPTGIPLRSGQKKTPKSKALPSSVDLREWCSAVEDQGRIGSCTAQAGVGIIEYY